MHRKYHPYQCSQVCHPPLQLCCHLSCQPPVKWTYTNLTHICPSSSSELIWHLKSKAWNIEDMKSSLLGKSLGQFQCSLASNSPVVINANYVSTTNNYMLIASCIYLTTSKLSENVYSCSTAGTSPRCQALMHLGGFNSSKFIRSKGTMLA